MNVTFFHRLVIFINVVIRTGLQINDDQLIDRDQWLNVTSDINIASALGRNRTRDPRVPEPKRTPLGYILP
jgi:hypothetical protein